MRVKSEISRLENIRRQSMVKFQQRNGQNDHSVRPRLDMADIIHTIYYILYNSTFVVLTFRWDIFHVDYMNIYATFIYYYNMIHSFDCCKRLK